jgi:hypothetical protein
VTVSITSDVISVVVKTSTGKRSTQISQTTGEVIGGSNEPA